MSSSEEHTTFTRPRDGDIREQRPDAALDVLSAVCASTEMSRTAPQLQAPPDMLTGQSKQACLRRRVPTDHEAHSQAQRRLLWRVATTELRRVPAAEAEAEHAMHGRIRTPKRNSRSTIAVMLKPFARARRRRERVRRSNQALESPTSTHSAWRMRRVVLVSPADHAQHAKVRAEEQRESEHAEKDTWVTTWTREQLVETAKTLTKPRPHIAQVV